MITNVLPQHFKDLIATTLGLQVREQEQAILCRKLLKRAHALGLSSLEAYYQVLATDRRSALTETEWRELTNLLTVNESYFFRDQGQFSLLKHHILPELIKRKQEEDSPSNQEIRVWSAGCSTGEEAYSLAILLKELLPVDREWTTLILGTDVNESALEQAAQGIYSDWSFRLVDSSIQKAYFRQSRQGWEIDPSIRRMVTFQPGNLVRDRYPNVDTEICNLDLILCRNVFIYFGREAVATVLDRFYQTLRSGGYLITGHTELYGQNLGQFQVKTYRESVAYQRPIAPDPLFVEDRSIPSNKRDGLNHISDGLTDQSFRTKTPVLLDSPKQAKASVPQPTVLAIAPHPHPQTTPPGPVPVDEVATLMARKAYAEAIRKAKQLIAQNSQHFTAYYLMAEAYANLGDYLNATQICQQVLQSTPFAVEPFYLLAQIAQEQGDLERAKNLLKRVIYLAPTSVYAYFELGCLYEQQGNLVKARRSWQSTLEILKPMSQQTVLGLCNRLTVAELQAATEQKLDRPIPT